MTHSASIVIPTRARPRYLEVALASIAPQAAAAGAEVLVVDDAGPSPTVRALVERFGARYEPHSRPLGLNVARNTGVDRSHGPLVVFVDDDVEVCPGWLDALLDAARRHPHAQVLTGPIRPRLEGASGWARHSCGREGPPITALDLGARDTDRVRYAWGANMALRRSALERIGPFDVTLRHGGDEQEWQDRLLTALRDDAAANREHSALDGPDTTSPDGPEQAPLEGPVLYVARAALDHRRSGPDARLRALARAAYVRGRAARRFDARRGEAGRQSAAALSLARELRTLAGCVGHVLRRRCPAGLTMVAHSFGRLQEGLDELRASRARQGSPPQLGGAGATGHDSRGTFGTVGDEGTKGETTDGEDFLSGESGTVGGFDAVRRELRDQVLDARQVLSGQRRNLARAARHEPPRRRVLVVGIERPEHRARSAAIRAELLRSRHDLELRFGPPGDLGKFENLNRLLVPVPDHDWLLVIDDDVVLPRGFLDRALFLAERFAFDLLQPAHRARSHAAWRVTRRRPAALARETRFVEIGPVTAFARRTFPVLLPFPDLRMGWGLDLHWAALARAQGWRCGVLDAVAIRHSAAPAADGYSRAGAVAEARAFLAEHPYLSAREAQHTITTHRHR